MTFYIRKDRKTGGYVVIRVGADYDMHAHIKSMNGCHQLMRLIDKGLEPKSQWLREAARRILTAEEFARLKQPRDRYINRPRRA